MKLLTEVGGSAGSVTKRHECFRPMALQCAPPHPEGVADNSPRFQPLSLPTSFSSFIENIYSFAHPQQTVPTTTDSLTNWHPIMFPRQNASQPRRRDQHVPIVPA